MRRSAVAGALARTTGYAIVTVVIALALTALVPQPAGEVFATIAYLAAVLVAIALGIKAFLPAGPIRPRTVMTTARALRAAVKAFAVVTVVALIGTALVSQPSGEALAALAYVTSIGLALAIGIRCWLRVRVS